MRPVEAADLPAIAAIYAHYVEHSYATFDLEPPTAADWRTRFDGARALAHPWVIREDGAGYAIAATFNVRPAWRTTVSTAIYLDPAQRRRGLGRPLYAALLDAARDGGFHVAVAGIALPNDASVALHEGLGYEPVGVMREVGHKFGVWRDVGYWQRRL
jgi:L-amino acid N-acyltransferase YncA